MRSLRLAGTRVSARVQGAELYSVRFDHGSAHGWASLCTCPFEVNCKHAYAAGLALLDRLRETPAEETPDSPAAATSGLLVAHVTTVLGRALKRSEQTWLRHLAEARVPTMRRARTRPSRW